MSLDDLGLFGTASAETAYMVGISGGLSLLFGLPIGVLLVVTQPGHIWPHRLLNRSVGSVVNAFRSTPFIILLVALIPVTRWIVGTSIGTTAAIVPLTIAATPYYARVAEMSLREVDRGLIEALQSLGATRWQIIREALVPEALPGLVSGFTVTLVTLVGASAMAGAIGAGGLGDVAIRYGYQRFDTAVMGGVIVILIVVVSALQFIGDRLARRLNKRVRERA
jgi:D-methionine transport system permease protein